MVFKYVAKGLRSLSATYFKVLRTWWTMQRCYSVFGKAAEMASLIPLSPSAQMIRISFTPLFFSPFKTDSILSFHFLLPELSGLLPDHPGWYLRWHKLPVSEWLRYPGRNSGSHLCRWLDKPLQAVCSTLYASRCQSSIWGMILSVTSEIKPSEASKP